jgi:hypothetical protein
MHPVWARVLSAILNLAPAARPPSPKLKLRPPPLISLALKPAAQAAPPALWPTLQLSETSAYPGLRLSSAPAGSGLHLSSAPAGSGLHFSDTFHITGGKIMNSSGLSFLFSVTPKIAVGIRPAVETFDIPSGRLRAPEGLAVLQIRF